MNSSPLILVTSIRTVRTNPMKSFAKKLFAVGAAALALAMTENARATVTNIFDDFNVNEGHFISAPPTASAQSTNVAGSSTADRVTGDGPLEGAGHQKLVLNATTPGTAMRLRHLSGSGTYGNNVAFTTSAGVDGKIGFYMKTTATGWITSINLDGPGGSAGEMDGSTRLPVNPDGAWHLYEWDLDNANDWGVVTSIGGGHGASGIPNGNHAVDSIYLINTNGTASSTIYMDFVAINPNGSVADLLAAPCLSVSGVIPAGPISTNSTQVAVVGVTAGATAVTVYQNTGVSGAMTPIGTLTTGIVAGTNLVTVTGLTKAAQVVATQTVGGQESCIPVASAGITVGGGANPRLRIAASIRQPGGLTGPIGANGGGPAGTTIYWEHATGANVAGGLVLQPSTNWQTVIFYPTDSRFIWNAGTQTLPDVNQYGILEGLGLAIDDLTDTGPYDVYVDNLRNGTTLLQDFENENPGSEVLFAKPGNSGTTSGNILPPPASDSATVSGAQAAEGTNSVRLRWQFNGTNSSKYVRLNALSTGGIEPTPNPIIDVTQPIAIDVLLLPVNKTVAHSIGLVGMLVNQTNCSGGSASFSVPVTPPVGATPTYTYQWKFKNVNIPGATTSSFTTNNITSASAGSYSVAVSDGTYTVTPAATLTVPAEIVIDSQPSNVGAYPGDGTYSASFTVSASIPDTCPCANSPALTYQWNFNGTPIAGATDVSYSINNAYMTNGGTYTVLVSNTCNHVTLLSSSAKLYVYDPNVSPITANCTFNTGLTGFYWTNQTSANAFTGSPTWTNQDGSIDFDWVAAGPTFDVYAPVNNFTIRWAGRFQPYYPNQTYTFYTASDDGVRLWVDGQLIIDKWATQSGTEWSGSIALGSSPVDFILEYFEQTGNAQVHLSYDSLSVAKTIIPSTQFCAADPGVDVPPVTKLTAPANNATAAAGASVTLTASVSAFSAPVNKVEFYNNGTNLVASVNAPGPYTTSWTPPASGVYNVTARTYYSATHTVNSPSNKLTVNAPALGSVTVSGIAGTTLNYSGGAGSQFVLLKSSDLSTPRSGWSRIATNASSPGFFTIPVGSEAKAYYSVKSE